MKIDFTYLETLSDGDADFIKDFVRTFEETAESLTKKMSEELAAKDLTSLGKTAHQLKPSAKMLSLDAGDTLEDIQNKPEIATKEIINQIKEECETALAKTKEWAKKQGVDL